MFDVGALQRNAAVQVEPVLRRVVKQGEAIAKQAASGRVVQRRTGAYQDSITGEVVADANPLGIAGELRADTPYAAVIEFGSKPHVIAAKNKPYLTFRVGFRGGGGGLVGNFVSKREVNHPGTKRTDLLRNALMEALRRNGL
jgi:hypothetical protein